MDTVLQSLIEGFSQFKASVHSDAPNIMKHLAKAGQNPKVMIVACSDSRVDPAILLQSNPGDIFVVRNVANIIPPYEQDERHHGTSAALEFAVCYLEVEHIIILGHSSCGGLNAMQNKEALHQDDFISRWVTFSDEKLKTCESTDELAKAALHCSYQNCLGFPWIKSRVDAGTLQIHRWFFDIGHIQLESFDVTTEAYQIISQ